MFDHLSAPAPDAILALTKLCAADTNPDKIDLGVGIYKDEQGRSPIMKVVKQAERLWYDQEETKKYIGTTGNAAFNAHMLELLLGGTELAPLFATAQGAGGSGALRVGAELIKLSNPNARVFVPTPTWANHIPLIGSAGLEILSYPYYVKDTQSIDFDAMCHFLRKTPRAGDIVVLHGCCHNPTGADLTPAQWDIVSDLLLEQGLVAFVDLAYLGMGDGLDADTYGVRKLAATQSEMMIAASCSKNFGLYRERTGLIAVKASNADQAVIVKGVLGSIMRTLISMPPDHGAAIVAQILGDSELKAQWMAELEEMRVRMLTLRGTLADALSVQGHEQMVRALREQKGMFSMLPLSKEQAITLRTEHSVYMTDSGRINIAGANASNIDRLAKIVLSVL